MFCEWIGTDGLPHSVPDLCRHYLMTRHAVNRALGRALTLLKARLAAEPDLQPVRVDRHVLRAMN